MNCENCSANLQKGDKFCTRCGARAELASDIKISDEKWWQRLLKVAYIILYLPILVIIPIVWSINASTYNYSSYGSSYTDNSGEAFWYCLLTLLIYMVIARLIKISVLYIAMGKKPQWKREFKRFF